MKKIIPLLILLCVCNVKSAEVITATITVTNPAVTGDTLTINASARYWTNAASSSTFLTNLVSKNATATNLYNAIASYPYSGPLTLRWSLTNQITLRSTIGGALAASLAGTWGTVSLSTQSGPMTFTALWPLENMTGATNMTNQGSSLVYGLSTYSTNAFATNSTANSNFITKGASPVQRISSPIQISGQLGVSIASVTNASFYNATNRGYVVALTNGYWTNGIFDSATITNLSVPGSGSLSVELNGTASGDFSLAVGGTASGYSSTAIGVSSTASSHASVALGTTATASATNALALGTDATAAANNGIAIGAAAGVADADSVAIGTSAASTTTNQIVLGSSSYKVTVPGRIEGAISTNSTLRGTNIINGRIDFTSRANTGLANGYNSAVVLGTNVYVRLSGHSAAVTNAGFVAEFDGSYHILEIDNPVNSVTLLDQSGLEATAANRIVNGTAALLNSTNNPVMVQVIYSATASRWRVISFR